MDIFNIQLNDKYFSNPHKNIWMQTVSLNTIPRIGQNDYSLQHSTSPYTNKQMLYRIKIKIYFEQIRSTHLNSLAALFNPNKFLASSSTSSLGASTFGFLLFFLTFSGHVSQSTPSPIWFKQSSWCSSAWAISLCLESKSVRHTGQVNPKLSIHLQNSQQTILKNSRQFYVSNSNHNWRLLTLA